MNLEPETASYSGIELCCDRLLAEFSKLSDEEKQKVYDQMRNIVKDFPKLKFDFVRAKGIRKALGLSVEKCIKKYFKGLFSTSTLRWFENGRLTPKTYNSNGIAYLKWLKENGF